jgi:hypothetical protein
MLARPIRVFLTFTFLLFSVVGKCLSISGKVLDSSSRPILTASISVYHGLDKLTMVPKPVKSDGSFLFEVPCITCTHIRLNINALGYKERILTLEVRKNENKADAGKIILVKSNQLNFSSISHNISADSKANFYTFNVKNISNGPIEIRSISIAGSSKVKTECLDLSPDLTIQLPKNAQTGVVPSAKIIDNNKNRSEEIKIDGNIELLPCKVTRLSVKVPKVFSLASNEEVTIRFEIPRNVKKGRSSETIQLNTEDWPILLLTLDLPNDQKVSTNMSSL